MTDLPPYLKDLNEAQRAAVLATAGPVLILAGAGAGKTRVLTHRIVHLVHCGVPPHQILAVTFTNKAATEMRERALALLRKWPPSERAVIDSVPTITTFHALGVRILREFHAELNLPKHFSIFDRSDSLRAVKLSLEKAGYNSKDYEPRKILSFISKRKSDGFSYQEKGEDSGFFPALASTVWQHYEEFLQQEKALDFDDLLIKTRDLLKTNPRVREALQNRWRYLHIDEYQDTNAVQLTLAELLTSSERNLCVVGDIDQNIYSWRGASIRNVLQFERHFPGALTILLEENYRSTKTIIAAANMVIAKNKNRIEKTSFTHNPEGEKISLYAAMTGGDEAAYIATTIETLLQSGVPASSVAVLYRTNFQSRLLEEAFIAADLPYQLLGTKFFERKEIKDVLSYIRLVLNPDSQSDLARVINEPTRGIGKVTLLKLLQGKRSELSGATSRKVSDFFKLLDQWQELIKTETPSSFLKRLLKESGLEQSYQAEKTDEARSRLENLRELVTLAQQYDDLEPPAGLLALLEKAALQSDQDELGSDTDRPAVRLMTVHASKGLEFPYVFIAGLEQGLFPHERIDDGQIDEEEERRLFYVALTRAAQKLYLSYAHLRTIYGSQRVNVPSNFLNDIAPELIEEDNPRGSGLSGYETTIFLD